jgi:hypothetical protein
MELDARHDTNGNGRKRPRTCNEFVFGAICPPAVTLPFTGVTCAHGGLRTGSSHPSRGGARRIVKLSERDVVHELEGGVLVTRRAPFKKPSRSGMHRISHLFAKRES